ncbi:MAG: STAS domain-containing protein [Candidatus Accumulibacter delftensis]
MIEQAEGRLRVTAPMVIANARALHEAGRRVLSSSQRSADLLLDLAGVAEVDSSALSTLFAWQRKAAERALSLRVVNPPASLISLAALYGVSELLPLA